MENLATIPRRRYISAVEAFMGQPLIKVLVGQRRVGKSRLLLMLKEILEAKLGRSRVFYINLEDYENLRYTDAGELFRLIKTSLPARGKAAILLDEIQDAAGFERVLRSLAADARYDLYITGSNARLLSGELATLLSGRYIEIPVYGLSFPEFLEFHKLKSAMSSLETWWSLGGLPQLSQLPSMPEIQREYIENILSSVFLKDVVSRHQIRHVDLLRRIAEYAADTAGSILSAKKIADFMVSQRMKLSPSVVADYLRYMEEAYLIFRVPREDLAGKKLLEIGEKWYFQDLGIKKALGGFENRHLSGVVENAVYLHLRQSGYRVTVGVYNGREIDFVARRGEEKLYIQTAYLIPDESVRKREFGNLLEIPDNFPKKVISLDPVVKGEAGIEHLHLLEFLSKSL
jgi:hypothetical protein